MKTKFTIASQRNPIYASYSDADIQNQYDSADNKRKALMLDYDNGKVTDEDIDAIDKILFRLDDELCARGF